MLSRRAGASGEKMSRSKSWIIPAESIACTVTAVPSPRTSRCEPSEDVILKLNIQDICGGCQADETMVLKGYDTFGEGSRGGQGGEGAGVTGVTVSVRKTRMGRINLPWRWRGGAVRWRGMFSERSGECGVAGIEGVEDVGCTYIKPATTNHHKVSMCNEMMRSAGSWASLEQSTSSHGIAMEP